MFSQTEAHTIVHYAWGGQTWTSTHIRGSGRVGVRSLQERGEVVAISVPRRGRGTHALQSVLGETNPKRRLQHQNQSTSQEWQPAPTYSGMGRPAKDRNVGNRSSSWAGWVTTEGPAAAKGAPPNTMGMRLDLGAPQPTNQPTNQPINQSTTQSHTHTYLHTHH